MGAGSEMVHEASARVRRYRLAMIRNTVLVEQSVEQVFDYAAQFDRHPEWQDDLQGATFDGPAAIGVTGNRDAS